MTQATAEAKVTKMDIARPIFNQVHARGYDLGGKTQRAKFIELATEAGLSKHCASTYFQNLSNQQRGQPLYKYNKSKAPTKAEVKQAEAQVMEQHRWMCVNAEGAEVISFPGRSAAQAHAKQNGLKWADRTKVA